MRMVKLNDKRSRTGRFAMLILAATVAGGGCGGSTTSAPATSGGGAASSSAPRGVSTASAKAGRRRPTCAAPRQVLAGVYHPSRLHVLARCRAVSGRVVAIHHDTDGDLHIYLDTGGALTNAANRAAHGALVVEFMPRDGGHLPAPAVGDHIRLTGAWVLDAEHGWREIHPVWSERLRGVTYHSGPQFGGSPAGVGSSEAAASCTSNGHPCQGYRAAARSSSGSATTSSSSNGSAASGPSGAVPASHLRAGEFCSPSKEGLYEASGYACSPASDGRNRLHRR